MSERCAPKKNFCQFHDTKTVTVRRICSYIRRRGKDAVGEDRYVFVVCLERISLNRVEGFGSLGVWYKGLLSNQ